MKLIKNLVAILLLSILFVSCKETKSESKTDESETVEINVNEDVTESKDVSAEDKENDKSATTNDDAFNYKVNYPKDTELASEVEAAIKEIIETHPELKVEFKKAYGFAVYPKITKAGLGIGGAGGKGLVFEKNAVIGLSKLMQATLGFQAGGQQYKEVLFFESKAALDQFTNEKFKFSSEASAVAVEKGVSTNVAYYEGVATIVESEKGAMFEASLGTQKFKFDGDM